MIIAKFKVEKVTKHSWGREDTELLPVCGTTDKESENSRFYAATPTGKIELGVDNKAVHGFFVPGKEYIVKFEAVEPAV